MDAADEHAGDQQGEEAAEVAAAAAPMPSGKKHAEHLKLVEELKNMQKSRPTLDVVFDILSDSRIKMFTWMPLGRTYVR